MANHNKLTYKNKRRMQEMMEQHIMKSDEISTRELITDVMPKIKKELSNKNLNINRRHLAGMLRHILYQENSSFFLKQRYPGVIKEKLN